MRVTASIGINRRRVAGSGRLSRRPKVRTREGPCIYPPLGFVDEHARVTRGAGPTRAQRRVRRLPLVPLVPLVPRDKAHAQLSLDVVEIRYSERQIAP